ncbi:MAG: hypothetical protein ACOCSE_02470 [Chitinivibrionales bacterium]
MIEKWIVKAPRPAESDTERTNKTEKTEKESTEGTSDNRKVFDRKHLM